MKYKKRLLRIKNNNNTKPTDTPKKQLQKMADTPESRKDLIKNALFGEVFIKQLQEIFSEMKTVKEKRLLTKVILGKLVDKYKLWRMKE